MTAVEELEPWLPAGVRGELVAIPGARLFFLRAGEGEPLVLLHANTGTAAVFSPQLAHFAAAGYQVIAPDRRGWGRSLAVPEEGNQPGAVAEDLDALLDHLGIDSVHLLGVAGGGFVALDFAAWRPERVRTLVVGASTGLVQEDEVLEFSARIRIPPISDPVPPLWREVSAGYRGRNPEGAERWVEIDEHAKSADAAVRLVRSPNTYEKLGRITAPMLALAGGADLIAPAALMRLWVAHIPHAEFAVIPEAGHSLAYEEPEAFNALVGDFLARHR